MCQLLIQIIGIIVLVSDRTFPLSYPNSATPAFLGQLFPKELKFEPDLPAKQQFNLFIHQLWQGQRT
jgi:hypothetical protein